MADVIRFEPTPNHRMQIIYASGREHSAATLPYGVPVRWTNAGGDVTLIFESGERLTLSGSGGVRGFTRGTVGSGRVEVYHDGDITFEYYVTRAGAPAGAAVIEQDDMPLDTSVAWVLDGEPYRWDAERAWWASEIQHAIFGDMFSGSAGQYFELRGYNVGPADNDPAHVLPVAAERVLIESVGIMNSGSDVEVEVEIDGVRDADDGRRIYFRNATPNAGSEIHDFRGTVTANSGRAFAVIKMQHVGGDQPGSDTRAHLLYRHIVRF